MKRRSKGLNEFFFSMGPLWKLHARIRSIRERKQSIHKIVSPDWYPISAEPDIDIPQDELTPWLPLMKPSYASTLSVWDEDFWMTQEIGRIYIHRNLLNRIYETFIKRNEQQFYLDYCPIRWSVDNDEFVYTRFDDVLDLLVPEQRGTSACNFAISIEKKPRPFIKKLAKENEITISKFKSIVLWARYDFLRKYDSGLNMIRYYHALDKNVLKFGFPYLKRL